MRWQDRFTTLLTASLLITIWVLGIAALVAMVWIFIGAT